jgi:hypothetical protein
MFQHIENSEHSPELQYTRRVTILYVSIGNVVDCVQCRVAVNILCMMADPLLKTFLACTVRG